MDGRTRLAIGGIATVAASVAVICTVALTNSAALSHADAVTIRAPKIVVPEGARTAAAQPTPQPAPSPKKTSEPADPIDTAPAAEIVPAPAPVIVAPSVPSAPEPSPSAPAPEQASAGDEEAIAEAVRTGAWDTIREWAAGWGWSSERIEAWIAKLQKLRDAAGQAPPAGDEQRQGVDADGNRVGDEDVRTPDRGKDKDRSMWTDRGKKRPAEAGANAGGRPFWLGDGAKKDRSQVPPDLVDR